METPYPEELFSLTLQFFQGLTSDLLARSGDAQRMAQSFRRVFLSRIGIHLSVAKV
jgi:hypothetical protein